MIKTLKAFVLASLLLPAIGFAQCSINSGSYNAGVYNPISFNTFTATTSISIDCITPQNVLVSASGGNSNNPISRFFLNQNNEKIFYNIYLNFDGSSIFGDGISTTKYSGQSGKIPLYIKIPSKQNVEIGNYYDNIFISVDF